MRPYHISPEQGFLNSQMVWHNFVESITCFTSGTLTMLFHRVNNGDIAFPNDRCIGRTKGALQPDEWYEKNGCYSRLRYYNRR